MIQQYSAYSNTGKYSTKNSSPKYSSIAAENCPNTAHTANDAALPNTANPFDVWGMIQLKIQLQYSSYTAPNTAHTAMQLDLHVSQYSIQHYSNQPGQPTSAAKRREIFAAIDGSSPGKSREARPGRTCSTCREKRRLAASFLLLAILLHFMR